MVKSSMDRKKPINNHIAEAKGFKVFAYVMLIIFVAICILPFINIISKSFSSANTNVTLLPVKPSFYSYKMVLGEKSFYQAFGITLLTVSLTTLSSVVVLLLAAYPLSKSDLPFRKGLMLFFVIIMLFSGGIVPNFLWYMMLGMLNTLSVLILPSIVSVFNLILIKSYFEGLSESIEEAAKIDGASNLRVLFTILVPMSMPIVITVGLFTVVATWNNYQSALYYLPNKAELYPLAMYILNFIHSSAVDSIFGDPVRAAHKGNIEAAMIVLSILPIALSYPFFLKYFTRGVMLGSVKE